MRPYSTVRQGMEWPDVFTQRIYPRSRSIWGIFILYKKSRRVPDRSMILGLLKTQVPYTHRHTVCVHTYCTYVKDQALFKKRPAIGYRVRVRMKPVPDKASLSGYELNQICSATLTQISRLRSLSSLFLLHQKCRYGTYRGTAVSSKIPQPQIRGIFAVICHFQLKLFCYISSSCRIRL